MRFTQFVAALVEIAANHRPLTKPLITLHPVRGQRHHQGSLPRPVSLTLRKRQAPQRAPAADAGHQVSTGVELIAPAIVVAQQHTADAVALQVIVRTVVRTRRQKHLHARVRPHPAVVLRTESPDAVLLHAKVEQQRGGWGATDSYAKLHPRHIRKILRPVAAPDRVPLHAALIQQHGNLPGITPSGGNAVGIARNCSFEQCSL